MPGGLRRLRHVIRPGRAPAGAPSPAPTSLPGRGARAEPPRGRGPALALRVRAPRAPLGLRHPGSRPALRGGCRPDIPAG